MTGKHTDAPWRLFVSHDARPHSVFLRRGCGSIDVPNYGFDDPSGAVRDEMLANAHLIAAAPEMLEALKLAWDILAREGFGTAAKIAHEVISKAEGTEK